jgi:hypothetical protein
MGSVNDGMAMLLDRRDIPLPYVVEKPGPVKKLEIQLRDMRGPGGIRTVEERIEMSHRPGREIFRKWRKFINPERCLSPLVPLKPRECEEEEDSDEDQDSGPPSDDEHEDESVGLFTINRIVCGNKQSVPYCDDHREEPQGDHSVGMGQEVGRHPNSSAGPHTRHQTNATPNRIREKMGGSVSVQSRTRSSREASLPILLDVSVETELITGCGELDMEARSAGRAGNSPFHERATDIEGKDGRFSRAAKVDLTTPNE